MVCFQEIDLEKKKMEALKGHFRPHLAGGVALILTPEDEEEEEGAHKIDDGLENVSIYVYVVQGSGCD